MAQNGRRCRSVLFQSQRTVRRSQHLTPSNTAESPYEWDMQLRSSTGTISRGAVAQRQRRDVSPGTRESILARDHTSAISLIASTPLITAAFNGQVDVATLLIEKGAAVNQADNHGQTPLQWAAFAFPSTTAVRHVWSVSSSLVPTFRLVFGINSYSKTALSTTALPPSSPHLPPPPQLFNFWET